MKGKRSPCAPRSFLALSIAIALGLGPAARARAAEVGADARTPQSYGHFVGDLLEVRVTVQVPEGFRFDPASARSGELPEWLELRHVEWKRGAAAGGTRYELRFSYQVFYVPEKVTRLEVPAGTLRFRSAATGQGLEVRVPPVGFVLSPLTDGTARTEGDWAPARPSPLPVQASAATLAGWVALWLGASRFRRRRRGVFFALHRELRRHPGGTPALLLVHRALEAKAGQAVFGHDLAPLFHRWPAGRSARAELEGFFALSERAFYAGAGDVDSPEWRRWLADLARRLAELERAGEGAPWSSRTRGS